MEWNEARDTAYKNAVEHGFYKERGQLYRFIALCHSELSEALEEIRGENRMEYFAEDGKPEGVLYELVDCAIRILDWLGYMDEDAEPELPEKMVTEMDLVEAITRIHAYISRAWDWRHDTNASTSCLRRALGDIVCVFVRMRLDIEKYIDRKQEYNATRPYKHGKKF